MATPTFTPSNLQDLYWLQQQINAAAALMALTVTFVALKMTVPFFKLSERRPFEMFGGNDVLILASLIVLLPLYTFEISKCRPNNASSLEQALIFSNSLRKSIHEQ